MPMCEHTGPGVCPNPFHQPAEVYWKRRADELAAEVERLREAVHDAHVREWRFVSGRGEAPDMDDCAPCAALTPAPAATREGVSDGES